MQLQIYRYNIILIFFSNLDAIKFCGYIARYYNIVCIGGYVIFSKFVTFKFEAIK